MAFFCLFFFLFKGEQLLKSSLPSVARAAKVQQSKSIPLKFFLTVYKNVVQPYFWILATCISHLTPGGLENKDLSLGKRKLTVLPHLLQRKLTKNTNKLHTKTLISQRLPENWFYSQRRWSQQILKETFPINHFILMDYETFWNIGRLLLPTSLARKPSSPFATWGLCV